MTRMNRIFLVNIIIDRQLRAAYATMLFFFFFLSLSFFIVSGGVKVVPRLKMT